MSKIGSWLIGCGCPGEAGFPFKNKKKINKRIIKIINKKKASYRFFRRFFNSLFLSHVFQLAS